MTRTRTRQSTKRRPRPSTTDTYDDDHSRSTTRSGSTIRTSSSFLESCAPDGMVTCHFCASLKHKYDGQTKFIKPNSQRQDRIIKYWVSIGSIHREQG